MACNLDETGGQDTFIQPFDALKSFEVEESDES